MERKMKHSLWAGGALAAAAIAVGAAGLYTNGMPLVVAGLYGTTQLPAPLGVVTQVAPGQLSQLSNSPNCCGPYVPVDTNLQGGSAPQTVAATPFQVAATLGDAIVNAQVSMAGAATSNTLGGVVTTEALITNPGATYTFTLTNSNITTAYATAGGIPQVGIYSASNTGGTVAPVAASAGVGARMSYTAHMHLVSSTVTGGATNTVVWVFRNDGDTALNGTMYIVWHL